MRRALTMLFVAFHVALAHAQTDQDARKLFADGRAAMDRGDWADAETKLASAYDKLPGKGVAFNLAVCREHLGRLTSARDLFRRVAEAERSAGDEARAKIADDRIASVTTRLAHLRVVIAPSVHASVSIDAHANANAGEDVELDPGTHAVDVAALGFVALHDSVELREGEHRDYAPSLTPDAPAPVSVPIIRRSETPIVFAQPPHHARTAGIVTGVVGGSSLLTSAVFAIAAGSLYGSSSAYCNTTTNMCTAQRGVDLRNQSLSFGDASTATAIAGITLVAIGVVLWLVDGGGGHVARSNRSAGR